MRQSTVTRHVATTIVAVGALAVFCAAHASSTSTDYTDTWWNSAESGWGLQFVQQADVIFATLYVEDPQTNPVWYTAALRAGGDGVWRGDLFVTHGPWFGGPFNPAAVVNRRVGDFAATFTSSDRASIAYSVDGVPAAKSIARLTFANESLSGRYTLWLRATTANCTDVPPGALAVAANGTVVHSGNALQMSLTLSVLGSPISCTYNGDYAQSGRYGRSDGTYVCGSSDTGTYQLRDVHVTPDVLTGRITQRSSDGCTSTGPMAGYRD